MQTELLFTPKLTGERFERHTLPADVLSDIAALQEMLVSLAKQAYIDADPGRVRAPRNFDKEVQLHLGPRGEGSTALPLMLVFSSALVAPYRPAFETAQQQFTHAVDAASRGETPQLAPRYLTHFEKIGRSLRSGEALQVPMPSGATHLTQETRQRLLRAAQMEEWTDRMTLRARISSTNLRTDKYELHLLDGDTLTANLTDDNREQIRAAHGAYDTGSDEWLVFQGVVRKSRNGKLLGFDTVDDISPPEVLDVPLRLLELSSLQDGWLDGTGTAPDGAGLLWLGGAFDRAYADDLPLPHMYPTPEGGIQAEWDLAPWSISLLVNLQTHAAEFLALELETQQDEEATLDLNSTEGWSSLNERLRRLLATAPEGQTA